MDFLNVMDHPSLLLSISINSTQLRSHRPKEKAEVKATSLINVPSKQAKRVYLFKMVTEIIFPVKLVLTSRSLRVECIFKVLDVNS